MKDPARLLDDPCSDLDVLLLESGLDEEPPARIADRTLVALGVASAAAGAGAAAVGASAGIKAAGTLGWWAGPWALVAKIGIGVAVVGGVVGGGYAVLSPPAGGAAPAEPAAVEAPPSPRQAGAEVADKVAPASDERDETAGDPTSNDEAAGAKALVPGTAPPDAAKPAKAADASKPRSTKPPTEAAKPAEGGSTLAQERQLIESARASLRSGDKAGAIATLDSYPGRFPNGQLKNEVTAMRQAIAASP